MSLQSRNHPISYKRNPLIVRCFLFFALLSLLTNGGCRRADAPLAPPPNVPQAVNVSTDPWTLITTSPFGHHGGYLGNGFVGMRFGPSGTTDSPDSMAPAFAEGNNGRLLQCIVSGLYSKENLAPAPNWGSFKFRDTRGEVYPETGRVTDYRQTLDMRRGELITTYTVPHARPAFSVELVTRVHRDIPNLITFSARLAPQGDGRIQITVPLEDPSPEYYEVLSREGFPHAIKLKVKESALPAHRFLSIHQQLEARDAQGRDVPIQTDEKGEITFFEVKEDQPLTLTKWVYVSAAKDQAGLEAPTHLEVLRKKGWDALIASHRAAWGKLWESDIQIEGDLEAQHAVRSSLFYLLGSVREGGQWSIPPMGLSGVQWGGHIFWDADTWMFPVMGLLHPELAQTMVDYRVKTLEGAKWNAAKNGYKGADYATESAVTGREIAPAEFPFHDQTSADVAMAQWRHYLLSGDRQRLEEKGYPILREAAIYYQSRVVYNKPKDRYEIKRVISPDETAGYVDNDVYTNAAAKFSLRYAIEASRLLGKPYPKEWSVIADKIWLPFDEANQRYIEHEGYQRTRRKPKQADAQLLFFPLDLPASHQVKSNTLTYYAEHTSPIGPAMTASVHAVIAADLATSRSQKDTQGTQGGKAPVDWLAKAEEYFHESYRPFLRPPFNDFSEKRTMNNTTFLTGCAGVLMGPLYGFGGIRYDERGITAHPVLPSGWKRLRITGIHYRGSVYDLAAAAGGTGGLKKRGTSNAAAAR